MRVTSATRNNLVEARGLFAALLLLMLGRGLVGVLLGVRAELEGFPTTTTGVIMASYFVGFLAGSQLTPRLMARVGHIRVFSGLSSIVAVAALLHVVWVAPIPWIVLRVVFGFAMAGLFVVAESWLNETVTNDNRGRMMAIYMVVSMGGVALGQFLLATGDPMKATLFIVSGALISVAVVPITMSIASAPAFELPPSSKFRDIWEAAPLGMVGSLFSGLANSALLGMVAVYASQVGMSVSRTGLFAGIGAFGAVALQWPIGHLSDVVGRRLMILYTSAGATVVAAVAVGLDPGGVMMLGAMFLFGGLSYPMYSLSLSHMIDVLPVGMAVTASSTNVFVTGVGAIFGPLAVAAAMSTVGPVGFWWVLALSLGAVGGFALSDIIAKPYVAEMRPEPYMAIPARSAGIVRMVRGRARHREAGRDDIV